VRGEGGEPRVDRDQLRPAIAVQVAQAGACLVVAPPVDARDIATGDEAGRRATSSSSTCRPTSAAERPPARHRRRGRGRAASSRVRLPRAPCSRRDRAGAVGYARREGVCRRLRCGPAARASRRRLPLQYVTSARVWPLAASARVGAGASWARGSLWVAA
jgi:hypothetical protein